MDDGWTDDGRRTPDHGYTISSPCEPNGSGELITGVLNVLDTLKNNWLKVYKFMCIQTQEDHIGHIKQ